MPRIHGWLVSVWVGLLVSSAPSMVMADSPENDPSAPSGRWIKLFDGETLFGWSPTSAANWRIADGILSVDQGEPGFMMSNATFADFELRVEFQTENKTNSGIFVRSTPLPKDPLTDCYEVNLANHENPFPLGSLVGRQRSEQAPQVPEWQIARIRCVGPRIQVWIDEQQITDYSDPNPRGKGRIGLQFNGGRAQFRKVALMPLSLVSLLANDSLDGWHSHPEMGGEFLVDAGELQVRGGPGQLESKTTCGNFVLQLECKTNAANLNSGVFFRCIPGDRMMGYESQIHNGFHDDDRTRPVDCGTGGIFRRQNARRVVPNDLEWFHKTIVAHDNHLAVWVNGYQVADWLDTRKADENPRRGCRVEPGSIIFQAHDPSTDVSFRNINVAKMGNH